MLLTSPTNVPLHSNLGVPTRSVLRHATVERLNTAIVIGSPKDRDGETFLTGRVYCAVNGGNVEIILPSHEGIADVDDEGAGDGNSLNPFFICVQYLKCQDLILRQNREA